jgi:Sulfotransferase family
VEKWQHYIRTARAVGAALPPGQYHEVRYERLVNDTETTMRELLEFLGEGWDPAVLQHDRRQHDISTHYRSFNSARRRTAQERTAVYRSRVGAHRREMDPLLRVVFHLRSGGMLRELGYR